MIISNNSDPLNHRDTTNEPLPKVRAKFSSHRRPRRRKVRAESPRVVRRTRKDERRGKPNRAFRHPTTNLPRRVDAPVDAPTINFKPPFY